MGDSIAFGSPVAVAIAATCPADHADSAVFLACRKHGQKVSQ